MVEVTYALLTVSLILFFGFFAEFIFKRFHIPDILFLILLGFILGPYVTGYLKPEQFSSIAPFFTAFALLFLLYDGAFNIDLASFAKGLSISIWVTLFNFFVSAMAISGILVLLKFDIRIALLAGFILGGVSSAFVIPTLKQLNVKGEIYSVLTLESALTDVLCIVFAFTVMEIIKLNTFSFKVISGQIASLFAVAGIIGIISGAVWIIIVRRVLKQNKSYIATIAYLLLVYVITEYLGGNGAIASLFFGLVLKNSKQLINVFRIIIRKKANSKKEVNGYEVGLATPTEQLFYSQISFFLKTFFFVYIGILFNIRDIKVLLIGAVLAIAIMLARNLSKFVSKRFDNEHRELIKSIFARGLAAAAIAQVVMLNKIEGAMIIQNITYTVIIFTILLSSIKIYLLKRKIPTEQN